MRRTWTFGLLATSALLSALVAVIGLRVIEPAAQPARAMTMSRQWLAPASGVKGEIAPSGLEIIGPLQSPLETETPAPTSPPPPPTRTPAPSPTALNTPTPAATATPSPTPPATPIPPTPLPTDTPPWITETPETAPAPTSGAPARAGELTYHVSAIQPVDEGKWGVALCATNPTDQRASSVRLRLRIERGTLLQIVYVSNARVIARRSSAQLAVDSLPAGQRLWLAALVESAVRPGVTVQVESSLGAARRAADPACGVPVFGAAPVIARIESPEPAPLVDVPDIRLADQPLAPTTRLAGQPLPSATRLADQPLPSATPGLIRLTVPVMRDTGLSPAWLWGSGIAALLLLLTAAWLLAGLRRSDSTRAAGTRVSRSENP